ncbi:MAG: hypothetical protein ACPHGY_05700 [Rhodospirillaceae bacterium]|jgi:hypothetical protein
MERRKVLGVLGFAAGGAGFPTIIGSKSAGAGGLLDPSKPEDL